MRVRASTVPLTAGPRRRRAPASAAYDAIVRAVDDARRGARRRHRHGARQQGGVCDRRACHGTGTPICSAHLTGSPFVAMMFESPALRVVLATVHVALADVPRTLTPRSRWIGTIRADRPRVAAVWRRRAAACVAGLNPHAGEHGLMGREDDDVLAPAVARCRAAGIDVAGPAAGRHGLSCARTAASSTPSSPVITIRA